MKLSKIYPGVLVFIFEMFFFFSCKKDNNDKILALGREPVIEPDYSGVIIPPNIAPMNFIILEDGKTFKIIVTSSNNTQLSLKSSDGIVRFPQKSWKKLLAGSEGGKIKIDVFSKGKGDEVKKYDPVYLNVAQETVDPYLCYRLLYPGYESWGEMKIIQRSTQDFRESSLFENQLLENNCVNCHSFLKYNPARFFLHVRGSLAGTYFVDGDKVTRKELKTQNMPGNAVFPSWHPSGNFVVFSSNRIYSVIHMLPDKNIELYDRSSFLVFYNIEKNEMSQCSEKDSVRFMETFPCWSPDGKCLYYCRTEHVQPGFDFKQIKYDLVRKSFNEETGEFGKTEVVFNAHELNKSASLPAISPDGQYLVFTLHDYGTFPVWHKEADLYIIDLQNREVEKMGINSNETESYHSWSSNGKWLVFSSKRDDGLSSRPYVSYFGSPDKIGKPFILPQKDPTIYKKTDMTFNRPEFITGKIKIGPRYFARASKKESLKATWVE